MDSFKDMVITSPVDNLMANILMIISTEIQQLITCKMLKKHVSPLFTKILDPF